MSTLTFDARVRQLVARERPHREVPDAAHGVVEQPTAVDDEHGLGVALGAGQRAGAERLDRVASQRRLVDVAERDAHHGLPASRSAPPRGRRRSAPRGPSVAPSTATSRRPAHELCRNSSAIHSSSTCRSVTSFLPSTFMRSRLRPCGCPGAVANGGRRIRDLRVGDERAGRSTDAPAPRPRRPRPRGSAPGVSTSAGVARSDDPSVREHDHVVGIARRERQVVQGGEHREPAARRARAAARAS